MKMKNWVSVSIFLLILPVGLLAQTYQPMHLGMSNWYFGNTPNGLKFNRVSTLPTIINNKVALGTGGSATATNPTNGNLLFYTDGSNVYDACNLLMQNGSGLLGNPTSNQPVAICPVPGQPNKYFIFSNSATNIAAGSITYDVVDLSLLGNSLFPSTVPLGDLEAPFHSTIGVNARAEAMLIVPHTNGTDFWLLTQAANSQDYSYTLINAASYNLTHTGTFTTTTISGLGLVMSASHFAWHDGRKLIAVAPTTANTDAIILSFNNTLGGYALNRTINNSASGSANNQAIYDIEWSGDGNYVYYSVFGDEAAAIPVSGDVYQYDYPNFLTTLASALPSPVFRSYGLQLAPDSSIYHIYQTVSGGSFQIGKISDPDSVASKVNYALAQFGSVPDWNAMQFTSVLPQIKPVITVTFNFTGTCQNTPTSFYPNVTPYADSLVWDFGDGNPPVNAWSPIHTYQNASTYNVQVIAYAQGQPQFPPTINAVTINPFPLTLQLVSDTTACTFEFPPPKGTSGPPLFSVKVRVSGGTASSFVWSNGDNTNTLFPADAGYYYVVVGDGSGCTAYAGVNVKEYGVPDQRANIWYFGNNAGIDFNNPPPVALSNSLMTAPEGCSAMSDRNGDIIFYTDGNTVYIVDKASVLIPKPHIIQTTGIGGNTASTQSALIVPVPGDETLFYIFTTEAKEDYPSNAIYYSLFDLKQNSGAGAVTIQKQLLYSGSTERLTSNGNWLITHEYGNNSFRCYPITPAGLGQPVITSIGSDHVFKNPTLAEGYMKIGNGNNVAVPLSIPGTSNLIEVFHFSDSTGSLSNYRQINLNEPNGQAYGVEFSPGGNKLFATVKGSPTPSFIYEYSIDSINRLHFKQKVTDAGELGAVQIAPDGQIYIAINGSSALGSVLVNEDTTQLSTFNFAGFTLAGGTTSTLGLPSFVQQTGSAFGGPGMNVAGFCFGTPMDYVATPTDPIDTFLWGFGDGATSNTDTGQHSYAAPGPYTVTLVINNRCLIHDGTPPFTFTQNITIVNPPAPPTIPVTSALCVGAITLDANTGLVPGLTYLWSTTETTQQISVNAIGLYSVTLTDATGCTSTGATDLQDARPVVNLGPDQTVCEGQFVVTLNANNPPPSFSHVWRLDAALNGNTTPTQAVSTATPGTDTYQVTVTNLATNCVTIEDVVFSIKESPGISLTVTDASTCLINDGKIDLTIAPLTQTIQPPTHTFTVFGIGSTLIGQSVGMISFPGLGDGNYTVFVEDEISGCTISQNATIGAGSNTLTVTPPPNVCPASTTDIDATTNAVVPFTYQVFDAGGIQVNSGPGATPNFSTGQLSSGTYTLQLTKAGCVVATVNNILIGQNPPIVFSITNNACAASPTLTGSAGPTYSWLGNNAPSTAVIQSSTPSVLTLNKIAGNYSYTVTATVGACSSSQPVTITLDPVVTVTIAQSDPCQNQVTLSAGPAGYQYVWNSPAASPDLSLLGQNVSITQSGTYSVSLISPSTGCQYPPAPFAINAQVTGPVTAAISSTAACNDGTAFVISAFTSASSPTYKWYRDTGTGFTLIPSETSATISQTTEGTYKVEIAQGACMDDASIYLERADLPVGTLPNLVTICDDPENADPDTDHYDLDPNPGVAATYDWFMKKTDQSPETSLSYTDQVYTAEKKGIYRVEITNTFNCTADDITEVLNDCVPKIVAPNAFRPGSGVPNNTYFFARTLFVTEDNFKVFVFNRWGELVYQASNRSFEWNGGYNNDAGNPLPSGSYAYTIQYVSSFRPDQGVQEKRGGVVLLR